MKRLATVLFLIFASHLVAVEKADAIFHLEAGSAGDTLTTTILNNGTASAISGTWSLSSNGATYMKVASNTRALLMPVYVSGVPYTEASGTRAITSDMNHTGQYAQYRLSPSVDRVTIGMWISIGSLAGSFQTVDVVVLENFPTGGFFVAQVDSGFHLQGHGDTASGTFPDSGDTSADINITADTWYWLTMDAVRAGLCTLKLYNTSGVLLGTSAGTINSNSPWRDIRIGRFDGHGGTQPPDTSLIKYDGIVINTTGEMPFPVAVPGNTYYVRSDGNNANTGLVNNAGGAWLTVAKATSTVVAGDTAVFQAGETFAETLTETTSGTSGRPITYIADGWLTGNAATVQAIDVSGTNVRVVGFNVNGAGSRQDGIFFKNANYGEAWFNFIHDFTRDGIRLDSKSDTYKSDYALLIGNALDTIGSTGAVIRGDHVLVAGNEFDGMKIDVLYGTGSYLRILNNYAHDGETTPGEHPDFWQSVGFNIPFYRSLFEGNFYAGNTTVDDDHGSNVEPNSGTETDHVWRGNVMRTGSYWLGYLNTAFDGIYVYNNTIIGAAQGSGNASDTSGMSVNSGISPAKFLNNIFQDTWGTSTSSGITVYGSVTPTTSDFNLAYDTTGSVTFTGAFNSEGNTLKNTNPSFVGSGNYSLGSGSSARNAGGRLTTVSNSATSATFTVADGGFFRGDDATIVQYGGALVAGEWLMVGTDLIQVASVSGNSITATASFTFASGDSVYFASDASPDMGAIPYGAFGVTLELSNTGNDYTATASDATQIRCVVFIEDGAPTWVDNAAPFTFTSTGGEIAAVGLRYYAHNGSPIVWETVEDTTAPTPDPSTIASVTVDSSTQITVVASTATDADTPPVEYNHAIDDSYQGWQSSATKVFSGLTPATLYAFKVKARDSVGTPNETMESSASNGTTNAASVSRAQPASRQARGFIHR